ncbi:MAG: hypothetical protein ACYC3T_12645, partial [Candidatus Humimicrobiaceae bacterium]
SGIYLLTANFKIILYYYFKYQIYFRLWCLPVIYNCEILKQILINDLNFDDSNEINSIIPSEIRPLDFKIKSTLSLKRCPSKSINMRYIKFIRGKNKS